MPEIIPNKYYFLKVGKASDLKNRDKTLYRLLEILPGALSWGTIFLLVALSFWEPVWVAIFIIFFDLYWLAKTIYLGLHLRSAYTKMRAFQKIDWRKKLETDFPRKWKNIFQVIILPIYKEPEKILTDSLSSLAESNWPREKIVLILTIEERAGNEYIEKLKNLSKKYKDIFLNVTLTVHPKNLPNEIKGKGANETWGAKVANRIIKELNIPEENILISSFDADTVIPKNYFLHLTYKFLSTKDNFSASYQPIPLFNNNIWEANAVSRTMAFSSTFWHILNQERPEKKITFSSHSLPFKPLKKMGYWQENVVSEDSRIFWNLFLAYDGHWRVEPFYSYLSMDANVGKSFWETMKNIYKQQRRWAYGVADTPYFIFGFIKNKKIPFRKKWRYGFPTFAGFYSWATNAIVIFLGGWLPLFFGGEKFNSSVLAYHLPFLSRNILTIAMVGLVGSAWLALQLLPPRPKNQPKRKFIYMVFQWFVVPITFVIFGSIPALEAQTRLMFGKYMEFWFTPKIRK